jgi:hypothetical protein
MMAGAAAGLAGSRNLIGALRAEIEAGAPVNPAATVLPD